MSDKILLVGVNRYPSCPLNGCVNDVIEVAKFLVENYKIDKGNIRLLTDERATTANILERLKWLVQDVKAGDRILYYFSGHGSQLSARADSGEPDGMAELICPVDYNFTFETAVADFQFVEIFSSIPEGVEFNWVSDSCHAGHLSKDMEPKKFPNHPKCFTVPPDIQWRNESAQERGFKALTHRMASKDIQVGFVSGCRDNQTSADSVFEGVARGALSYYLLKNLKNNLDTPLINLVEKIKEDLKKNGFSQEPQLEGADARKNAAFLK